MDHVRDVDVRTAEKPPTRSTEALIREIYLQRLARAVPEDIVCRPRLDGVFVWSAESHGLYVYGFRFCGC
jgi:hypothetical protein